MTNAINEIALVETYLLNIQLENVQIHYYDVSLNKQVRIELGYPRPGSM